jgi:transposase
MVDGTKGSHRKEGTTKMSENNINAAGIDTGKAKLDVALAGGKARLQIDNALSGWRELAMGEAAQHRSHRDRSQWRV